MSMRAVSQLQAQIEQDPSDHALLVQLADLLESRMEPEALEAWKRAVAAAPDDASTRGKYARYLAGDPEAAREASEQFGAAIALEPSAANLRMYANFLTDEPGAGCATLQPQLTELCVLSTRCVLTAAVAQLAVQHCGRASIR